MEIIHLSDDWYSVSPSVVTIGNFDGVHLGHQALLSHCVDLAEKHSLVSTVVLFEPQPAEFFSPKMAPARLLTLDQKLDLLRVQQIQRVVVCKFDQAFSQITAQAFVEDFLLKKLKVHTLCLGADFHFGYQRKGNVDFLKAYHDAGRLRLALYDDVIVQGARVSSTRIRTLLTEGDLAGAASLLGRTYQMKGEVIHGEKLGRKLGCPTANIDPRRLHLPLQGVYIGLVYGVADAPHPAALNIGFRPAVGGTQALLEAHLLDFAGDLYGKMLRVAFVKKLRDEAHFANLEALKQQMAQDVVQTRRYFEEQLTHG